ncbi:acetyltransferase, GNAT family [Geomicrobium sp. JCM 19037]|uniref:GNAT family N-acetyltransferase n=1 Tax=unclassified Geomicrobium TaxID=2628951 RepID=UPI00045F478D|nr:GNAT family protein [Geomicrobium sp. JCM 19037]GAK02121.1 acetyltransferase, GNAT family [Geomicrobium sp. JCM 19037]
MYTDGEITIRPVRDEDMERLWELLYREENPEWKKWDAPYFTHRTMPLNRFLERRDEWVNSDDGWVIEANGIVIGTVTYYYEDEMKNWLEMGIGIYDPEWWGGGSGSKALRLWMDHLFSTLPLVRVGLTTWSGNERMVRVAEKLGMKMEARIRNVRFYNNHYYDSIRMGVLREEWEQL